MCRDCNMWIKSGYFGTCIHSRMNVGFWPHTGKLDKAQIAENQMYSGKIHNPLTAHDYCCENFVLKDG